MTPSTVKGGFVSVVLPAHDHVELAGGGYYDPAALCSKVSEIQANVLAGFGIILNSLYTNPRQLTFNFLHGMRCVVRPHRRIICRCWNSNGGEAR